MVENLYVVLLLALVISDIHSPQSYACELIPSRDGNCFQLQATAYITSETSEFGPDIEGASVNPLGDMFAVNYGSNETLYQLGQMSPEQRLFYRDENLNSKFNGIRFLNSQTAFIADTINHRILKLTMGPDNVITNNEDYCRNVTMIQPNDLTLSKTGTVYTSGMLWIDDTNDTHGDIWSCRPDGTVQQLEILGRTNGIELSPDDQFLYVSESYNRGGLPYVQKVWRYRTNIDEGTITDKILFVDFDAVDGTSLHDVDGMKTDINGNLFVSRWGARHIAIFSPGGYLIGKIGLNFPSPTNLEFGGPNGTTLFIVGQCEPAGKGCVDRIEVTTPGRSWTMIQTSNAWSLHGINNYSKSFLIIVYLFYYIFKVLAKSI